VPKDQSPSHLKRDPPKFCSRECGKSARYTQVLLECRECSVQFRRKRYMATWSRKRGPFCGSKCYGKWEEKNLTEENNPNYKPESWLDLECHWCGEKFRRRKSLHLRQVSASKNAFCSRGCFEEYAVLGLRHKTIPWGSKIWKCRRNLALTRDRRRCVDCGSRHKLVVHHLRPFSKFDDPDEANRLSNLATVCQSCHRKRHEQMAALTGMTVEQDTDHSS
jgi:hypothetical protein